MNVFTFKPRFEAPALAGIKIHTLRGHRKDGKPRAKVGERISLRVWTGRPYASKQREFAQATVEQVYPVEIERMRKGYWIGVAGVILPPESWNTLARQDGFADIREMLDWFEAEHGLPFKGALVAWKDLTPVPSSANLMPL
jgi:hypothetical protein